jgi:hypothetical protein
MLNSGIVRNMRNAMILRMVVVVGRRGNEKNQSF